MSVIISIMAITPDGHVRNLKAMFFVDIKHHVHSLATRRFNFLTPLRPQKNVWVINHARNGYSCCQVQIKEGFEEHNSTASWEKSSSSGLNQARESTSNVTPYKV